MTLEELCDRYTITAKLGQAPVLGSRAVIGLSGRFSEPFGDPILPLVWRWNVERTCQTPFTAMDWAGEPIEAWRVILVTFTELLSYWAMKPGDTYLPFTSQHDLELPEVRKLDSEIRLFLGDTFEAFITAAWPHLYVPRYLRESLRACVEYKGGRKDDWRFRPKPQVEGYSEVRLLTFGDEEETGD